MHIYSQSHASIDTHIYIYISTDVHVIYSFKHKLLKAIILPFPLSALLLSSSEVRMQLSGSLSDLCYMGLIMISLLGNVC